MALFKFANFVATELEEGISAGATEMLVPLAATEELPEVDDDEEIRLVLWDGQQAPEIVAVTDNPQTGVLTIERAKESTTAVAWAAGTQVKCVLTAEIINTALAAFFDIETVLEANFLKLTGGTLSGALFLASIPSDPLHAATKSYVDAVGEGFLPISGGVLTGALNMAGNTIIGLPTPSTPTSAVPKSYADSIAISAIKWKEPVRVATTANGTLSTAFDNGSTVDDIVLATGNRILIKDQTDQSQNGIYVVQASGSPVRATDADANAELPGATVYVEEGTQNEASQWTCTNTTVTIGSSDIEFILIAAGTTYQADDNTLELIGNVFSVKDGGITVTQLSDEAVETAKIKDLNVTGAKIAADTIPFEKLAAAAIADQATAEAAVSSTTLLTPERGRQLVNKTPGVWNIIEVKNIDNAEDVTFEDIGDFDEIEVVFSAITPQLDGVSLLLQFVQSTVVVDDDEAYAYTRRNTVINGATIVFGTEEDSSITVVHSLDEDEDVSGKIWFPRPRGEDTTKQLIIDANMYYDDNEFYIWPVTVAVFRDNGDPIDGLYFKMTSGNIASGYMVLRGMYHG